MSTQQKRRDTVKVTLEYERLITGEKGGTVVEQPEDPDDFELEYWRTVGRNRREKKKA